MELGHWSDDMGPGHALMRPVPCPVRDQWVSQDSAVSLTVSRAYSLLTSRPTATHLTYVGRFGGRGARARNEIKFTFTQPASRHAARKRSERTSAASVLRASCSSDERVLVRCRRPASAVVLAAGSAAAWSDSASADSRLGRAESGSSLLHGFKEHVRPLLELNGSYLEREVVPILTQAGGESQQGVSTARIVVVGDQSHGKTSLLEALSTVDLPRGDGIKTRCPLVLQLRALRESDGSAEHALISAPGTAEQRIGDLRRVPQIVEEFTERLGVRRARAV